MRIVKVIFLLVFFFFCMVFFVQNTQMLSTPLVLKIDVLGLAAESTPVPFYVVLLLAFVLGGVLSALFFVADRVRLGSAVRSLQGKVGTLEKQLSQSASLSYGSYAAASAPIASGEEAAPEKKAEA